MKYLVCFGDSSLKLSKWVLSLEAKTMNLYDEIIFYDESSLDQSFIDKYQSFLINERGYGYWIWKPQILLQFLDKIQEGDIVNYIDVGCKLNFLARKRLIEYFNILDSSNEILAFQYGPSIGFEDMNSLNFLEEQFTKADLFHFFGLNGNSIEAKTYQYSTLAPNKFGVIF